MRQCGNSVVGVWVEYDLSHMDFSILRIAPGSIALCFDRIGYVCRSAVYDRFRPRGVFFQPGNVLRDFCGLVTPRRITGLTELLYKFSGSPNCVCFVPVVAFVNVDPF